MINKKRKLSTNIFAKEKFISGNEKFKENIAINPIL